MLVEKLIRAAVNLDRARVEVYAMQEVSRLQLPFGVTAYRLAFELELHDGRGLLHARHQKLVARAEVFHAEALGRVVGIDFARETFERRDRDAVALFELRQTPVAKRNSQHGRDERG